MRIDRIKFVSEMTRNNMTAKRLSELSGVSRVTVSSVKCGKSCTPETATKLAKALGVDVTKIIETEE